MEENTTTPERKIELPEPNPITRANHQRAFFREVLLPIGLFLLVSITLVVVFIWQGIGTVAAWSQIATIFLIIFWMLLALVLLAVLVGLVYLISYVLKVLPPYARLAQEGIETIQTQVEKGADITAKPVIQIKSFLAVVNAVFRRNQ
ncbi:MAG TPA: hypothetical protein VJ965_01705 [Anaerolineales bacterium]|nr:hypothetical protein [Anaerolineales bacterium]